VAQLLIAALFALTVLSAGQHIEGGEIAPIALDGRAVGVGLEPGNTR